MSSRRPPSPEEKKRTAPRLLNTSPQAKRARSLLNLGALVLGLCIGLVLHLKRLSWTDITFALRYGVAPIGQGLQVVQMKSDYFQASPSHHILEVRGSVYNHDSQPKSSPALMLTVLSPSGEFIKQFPATVCKVPPLAPHGKEAFVAQVAFEHPGPIGSYFFSEDTRVPPRPTSP